VGEEGGKGGRGVPFYSLPITRKSQGKKRRVCQDSYYSAIDTKGEGRKGKGARAHLPRRREEALRSTPLLPEEEEKREEQRSTHFVRWRRRPRSYGFPPKETKREGSALAKRAGREENSQRDGSAPKEGKKKGMGHDVQEAASLYVFHSVSGKEKRKRRTRQSPYFCEAGVARRTPSLPY